MTALGYRDAHEFRASAFRSPTRDVPRARFVVKGAAIAYADRPIRRHANDATRTTLRVEKDERSPLVPHATVLLELRELRRYGLSRAPDERREVGVREPDIEQRSVCDGPPILGLQPPQKRNDALGNRAEGEVFSDCERFVATLVDVLCDVEREGRKFPKQPVDVFRAYGAQERWRHAARDRRALDLRREDDFLTEKRTIGEDRDRHFMAIGRVPRDTNGSAFDQMHRTTDVAPIEKDGAFVVHLLDEEMLATEDGLIAYALEKPRLLEIPDLIFDVADGGSD